MNSVPTASACPTTFEDLVNQICDSIQNGDPIDIDRLAGKHPEFAEPLRQIFPTLLAIATLEPRGGDGLAISATAEFSANERLGDFRVFRQLGRGGMGVVYEAEQISIPRRVALKVLPLAALVDSRALQRFRNEVAAVATLEHPNIVPVYAVGEDRGIHFYAMKLIRGQSLAAVIRELRARADRDERLSGEAIQQAISSMATEKGSGLFCAQHPEGHSGKRVLTPFPAEVETRARGRSSTIRRVGDATYFRNVAKLIQQAAEALQHAHDHGIVHRDIKPGNLLLDGNGQLYVTDFGLARIETGAGVTMTGDVLGTLRYMSPEQVQSNRQIVDHRTDIYSLGATLYELLTLQPMWDSDDKAELIRKISVEEPTRPQKINPTIPTDLETIVLKAISKHPGERYQTVQLFGDDLQRLIESKPIVARRPTIVQRLNMWSRRNPSMMWAAMISSVIIAGGALISAGLVLSANHKTRLAMSQATHQRQRADRGLDQVLTAVETFLWRVGESQLEDIPGTERLRQELLREAIAICESLRDSESDEPQVRLRNADAIGSLATIQNQLGNDSDALDLFDEAIREIASWIESNPPKPFNLRARQTLAELHVGRGGVYLDLGENERAVGDFETGLGGARFASGQAEAVPSPRERFFRSTAFGNYAEALSSLGRADDAISANQEAIKILSGLVAEIPNDATYRVHLGWVHSKLASLYKATRDVDAAINHFQQSVSILREWADKSEIATWSRSILGNTCIDYGLLVSDQLDASEKLLKESEAIFTDLTQRFVDYPQYQQSLSDCYLHLAGLERARGDFPKSIGLLEKSIAISRSLTRKFPDRPGYRSLLGKSLMDHGGMLQLVNEHEKSRASYTEAIEQFELAANEFPLVPEHQLNRVKGIYNVALQLNRAGKIVEAESYFVRAAELGTKLVDEFSDYPAYALLLSEVHSGRAENFLQQENYTEALVHYELSLSIAETLVSDEPENPDYQELLLNTKMSLAATQCNLGDLNGALNIFLEAIPAMTERIEMDPANPLNKFNYAVLLGNVASTYKETNRMELAEKYFSNALQATRELHSQHPNGFVKTCMVEFANELAGIYKTMGQSEKADAAVTEAIAIAEQSIKRLEGNEPLFEKLLDVAKSALDSGRTDKSKQLLVNLMAAAVQEFGPKHKLTLRSQNQLGLVHLQDLNWKEATSCFQTIIDALAEIDPKAPDYRANVVSLGGAYCNQANALSASGEYEASIAKYTAAIDCLSRLESGVKDASSFLRNSFLGRANAYRRDNRLAEAFADINQAVVLKEPNSAPTNIDFVRCQIAGLQGDLENSIAETEKLLANPDFKSSLLWPAAGVFAAAAQFIESSESEPQLNQSDTALGHRNRAIQLLEKYVENNRQGPMRSLLHDLQTDPLWLPLREAEQFEDLIRALTNATGQAEPK